MNATVLPSGDVSLDLSSQETDPILQSLIRWVLAQETAAGMSLFSRECWRQLKRRDVERERLYAHGLALIDAIAKAKAGRLGGGEGKWASSAARSCSSCRA